MPLNKKPASKDRTEWFKTAWFYNGDHEKQWQPLYFSEWTVGPKGRKERYYFKGVKKILEERGLWLATRFNLTCRQPPAPDNMCCAHHLLASQTDFQEQESALSEVVKRAGHLFELYPKFHCECNFIERYWGYVKRVAREQCDYSFAGLRDNLPGFLDSCPLATIRRFERKSWCYIEAYHHGYQGREAEKACKQYKSHRRIFNDE